MRDPSARVKERLGRAGQGEEVSGTCDDEDDADASGADASGAAASAADACDSEDASDDDLPPSKVGARRHRLTLPVPLTTPTLNQLKACSVRCFRDSVVRLRADSKLFAGQPAQGRVPRARRVADRGEAEGRRLRSGAARGMDTHSCARHIQPQRRYAGHGLQGGRRRAQKVVEEGARRCRRHTVRDGAEDASGGVQRHRLWLSCCASISIRGRYDGARRLASSSSAVNFVDAGNTRCRGRSSSS